MILNIFEQGASMGVKKLIAGNWKMVGSADMAENFDEAMKPNIMNNNDVEWLICPPFPYIASLYNLQRGAQDCSVHEEGAFTGEISARMLKDMDVAYCIVGHSERRNYHNESNQMVKQKAQQLITNGIKPIICVGETEQQRQDGQAFEIVEQQLIDSIPETATGDNSVIAYEPVWAIGTGKVATSCDISKMHAMIRNHLETTLANGLNMRILYGGSVKPNNASEILNIDNVNGALIGGASLKVEDYMAIGNASK